MFNCIAHISKLFFNLFLYLFFFSSINVWLDLNLDQIPNLHGFPSEVCLILHFCEKPQSNSVVPPSEVGMSSLIYLTLDLYCPLPWIQDYLCERIYLTVRLPVLGNAHSHCLFRTDDDIALSFKIDALKSKETVSPLTLRTWSLRN